MERFKVLSKSETKLIVSLRSSSLCCDEWKTPRISATDRNQLKQISEVINSDKTVDKEWHDNDYPQDNNLIMPSIRHLLILEDERRMNWWWVALSDLINIAKGLFDDLFEQHTQWLHNSDFRVYSRTKAHSHKLFFNFFMQWFIDLGKRRLIAASCLKFIWRRCATMKRHNANDGWCAAAIVIQRLLDLNAYWLFHCRVSAASVSILFTFWVSFLKLFSCYGFLIPLTFGILIAFFDVNAMKKVHYTRKHHNTVIKQHFIGFFFRWDRKRPRNFRFILLQSLERTDSFKEKNTMTSVIIASNRINAFVRPVCTKIMLSNQLCV